MCGCMGGWNVCGPAHTHRRCCRPEMASGIVPEALLLPSASWVTPPLLSHVTPYQSQGDTVAEPQFLDAVQLLPFRAEYRATRAARSGALGSTPQTRTAVDRPTTKAATTATVLRLPPIAFKNRHKHSTSLTTCQCAALRSGYPRLPTVAHLRSLRCLLSLVQSRRCGSNCSATVAIDGQTCDCPLHRVGPGCVVCL